MADADLAAALDALRADMIARDEARAEELRVLSERIDMINQALFEFLESEQEKDEQLKLVAEQTKLLADRVHTLQVSSDGAAAAAGGASGAASHAQDPAIPLADMQHDDAASPAPASASASATADGDDVKARNRAAFVEERQRMQEAARLRREAEEKRQQAAALQRQREEADQRERARAQAAAEEEARRREEEARIEAARKEAAERRARGEAEIRAREEEARRKKEAFDKQKNAAMGALFESGGSGGGGGGGGGAAPATALFGSSANRSLGASVFDDGPAEAFTAAPGTPTGAPGSLFGDSQDGDALLSKLEQEAKDIKASGGAAAKGAQDGLFGDSTVATRSRTLSTDASALFGVDGPAVPQGALPQSTVTYPEPARRPSLQAADSPPPAVETKPVEAKTEAKPTGGLFAETDASASADALFGGGAPAPAPAAAAKADASDLFAEASKPAKRPSGLFSSSETLFDTSAGEAKPNQGTEFSTVTL